MRYAIFSDIHANLPAWNAIHADMAQEGAESILCLGDIVGYGPRPQEVLNAVRAATGNIVLGNHDAAVCGRMDPSIFNDNARQIVEWTRSVLNEESVNFFKEVPLTLNDGAGMLVVHAEIEEPGRFGYIIEPADAARNLLATSARITFVGHTHDPCVFVSNRLGAVQHCPPQEFKTQPNTRYVVNVGSAGEPRDWDVRASYCIYDDQTGVVTFRKVSFDVEAYRTDLEAVGLDIQPFFLYAYDHLAAGGSAPDEVVNPAANAAMTGRLHVPVAAQQKQALVTKARTAPAAVKKKTGALKLPGSAASPSARPPTSPAALPKENSSKTGILIGSLLAIATCLLGGLWLLTANNKKQVQQAQLAVTESSIAEVDIASAAPAAASAPAETPTEEAPEQLPVETSKPSAASSTSQEALETGIVFQADFEEGTEVVTAGGERKHLHFNTEPENSPFVPGLRGKALQVDPKSVLGISGEGELSIDSPFSLSVWLFTQEATLRGNGILSKFSGWGSGSMEVGYCLQVNNHLTPLLRMKSEGDDATLLSVSGSSLKAEKWQHLVVTYGGDLKPENVRFYIDGKQVKSLNRSKGLPTAGISNEAPLVIGNSPAMGAFMGKVDDVIIYNRVLKESEIKNLAER